MKGVVHDWALSLSDGAAFVYRVDTSADPIGAHGLVKQAAVVTP